MKQMSRRTFLGWSTTLAAGMVVNGCGSAATPTPAPTATPAPAPTMAVDSQVIKLVTGEYPPFSGETLPHQGITSQIMQWVFEDMAKPMVVDFKPWERGLEETLHGDYFATFPYAKNAERETQFYFSDPLVVVDSFFFVLADSNVDFTKAEDLTGRHVCRPQGWALYTLKDLAAEGKVTLEQPVDMDGCFKMLQAKRVDMLLVTESVGWATAERVFGSRDQFKMLPTSFKQVALYLMVSKNYPQSEALVAEFNLSLAKVAKRGDIEKILAEELK